MTRLAYGPKLIAPQYVKPLVKGQKNDAADAEAIVIAAQRPEMGFVEPKTEVGQGSVVPSSPALVHQRTDLVNALRAILYEYGHVVAQGIHHLTRILEIAEESKSNLPELVTSECQDLIDQNAWKMERIEAKTVQLRKLATETETVRRLQTMPGVGPQTALTVEAFAPDMASFKRGRDFAAWLGLVPQQHSWGIENASGGFRRRDKPTFAWRICWRQSRECSWRSP
jgi:transposase